MFGSCRCLCHEDGVDSEFTEVHLQYVQQPGFGEGDDVLSAAVDACNDAPEVLNQSALKVTEGTEWQPPLEHLALFDADRHRRDAATKLLQVFRQKVDLEMFSAESKPVHAAELEARRFCSDHTLVRHLMFCDGDEQKALASLKATVQWRAEFLRGKGIVTVGEGNATKQLCQSCMKDPRAHCFMRVGTDAAGHHVIYSCAGAAKNKKPLEGCKHLALELERIFNGNSVPGSVVLIVNMAGLGIADCHPVTPMMCLSIFFNHYPERFAQIILWGMPTIFLGTYMAGMKLFNPLTQSRFIVHKTHADRTRYAQAYWSSNPEMAAWLEAARRLKGAPGEFPDVSLSRQLDDKDTQAMLLRCAALTNK